MWFFQTSPLWMIYIVGNPLKRLEVCDYHGQTFVDVDDNSTLGAHWRCIFFFCCLDVWVIVGGYLIKSNHILVLIGFGCHTATDSAVCSCKGSVMALAVFACLLANVAWWRAIKSVADTNLVNEVILPALPCFSFSSCKFYSNMST